MWTDDELNKAQYVVFMEQESNRHLNYGTIEMPTVGLGPYLMTPVPPFGSLSTDNGVEGLKFGVTVPGKNLTIQYGPKTIPSPALNQTTLHEYGNGSF